MIFKFFFILAVSVFFSANLFAQTRYFTVSQTGPADFTSIQAAINHAVSTGQRGNFEIEVLDNSIYAEQITIDTMTNVHIRSTRVATDRPDHGPRPTIRWQDRTNISPRNFAESQDPILSGNFQSNGAVRIINSRNIIIEGFDIDGVAPWFFMHPNVWNNQWPVLHGNAGIALYLSRDVNVRNNRIFNCWFAIFFLGRNQGGMYANPNPADIDVDINIPLANHGQVGRHIIEKNMIFNNSYAFGFESEWDLGSTIRYNIVTDNFTRNPGTVPDADSETFRFGGIIRIKDVVLTQQRIYNNTFNNNAGTIIGFWKAGRQFLLFNNLFTNRHAQGNPGDWRELITAQRLLHHNTFDNTYAAVNPVTTAPFNNMRPATIGFRSTLPTSTDYMVPQWGTAPVTATIRNRGWPESGVRNHDGSVADVGAISFLGDGTIPVWAGQFDGPRLVLADGLYPLIDATNNARLNFILRIENGGPNDITDIEFFYVRYFQNIPFVAADEAIPAQLYPEGRDIRAFTTSRPSLGANSIAFNSIGAPGTYANMHVVVRGRDRNGNWVFSNIGIFPYRRIDYFFVAWFENAQGQRVTEVVAGEPVTLRIEAYQNDNTIFEGPAANIDRTRMNFNLFSGNSLYRQDNATILDTWAQVSAADFNGRGQTVVSFRTANVTEIISITGTMRGQNVVLYGQSEGITVLPATPERLIFQNPQSRATTNIPLGNTLPITARIFDRFGNWNRLGQHATRAAVTAGGSISAATILSQNGEVNFTTTGVTGGARYTVSAFVLNAPNNVDSTHFLVGAAATQITFNPEPIYERIGILVPVVVRAVRQGVLDDSFNGNVAISPFGTQSASLRFFADVQGTTAIPHNSNITLTNGTATFWVTSNTELSGGAIRGTSSIGTATKSSITFYRNPLQNIFLTWSNDRTDLASNNRTIPLGANLTLFAWATQSDGAIVPLHTMGDILWPPLPAGLRNSLNLESASGGTRNFTTVQPGSGTIRVQFDDVLTRQEFTTGIITVEQTPVVFAVAERTTEVITRLIPVRLFVSNDGTSLHNELGVTVRLTDPNNHGFRFFSDATGTTEIPIGSTIELTNADRTIFVTSNTPIISQRFTVEVTNRNWAASGPQQLSFTSPAILSIFLTWSQDTANKSDTDIIFLHTETDSIRTLYVWGRTELGTITTDIPAAWTGLEDFTGRVAGLGNQYVLNFGNLRGTRNLANGRIRATFGELTATTARITILEPPPIRLHVIPDTNAAYTGDLVRVRLVIMENRERELTGQRITVRISNDAPTGFLFFRDANGTDTLARGSDIVITGSGYIFVTSSIVAQGNPAVGVVDAIMGVEYESPISFTTPPFTRIFITWSNEPDTTLRANQNVAIPITQPRFILYAWGLNVRGELLRTSVVWSGINAEGIDLFRNIHGIGDSLIVPIDPSVIGRGRIVATLLADNNVHTDTTGIIEIIDNIDEIFIVRTRDILYTAPGAVDPATLLNALTETDTIEWFLGDSLHLTALGLDTTNNVVFVVPVRWLIDGTTPNNQEFVFMRQAGFQPTFRRHLSINDLSAVGSIRVVAVYTDEPGKTKTTFGSVIDPVTNIHVWIPDIQRMINSIDNPGDTVFTNFNIDPNRRYASSYFRVNDSVFLPIIVRWEVVSLRLLLDYEIDPQQYADNVRLNYAQVDLLEFTLRRNNVEFTFYIYLVDKIARGIFPNPVPGWMFDGEESGRPTIYIGEPGEITKLEVSIFDQHGNYVTTLKGIDRPGSPGDFRIIEQPIVQNDPAGSGGTIIETNDGDVIYEYDSKKWDGRNTRGNKVQSGVFVLVFRGTKETEGDGGEKETRRFRYDVPFYVINKDNPAAE